MAVPTGTARRGCQPIDRLGPGCGKAARSADADPDLLPGIKHLIGRNGVELEEGVWNMQKKVDFCTGEAVVNCLMNHIKLHTKEEVRVLATPRRRSAPPRHHARESVAFEHIRGLQS